MWRWCRPRFGGHGALRCLLRNLCLWRQLVIPTVFLVSLGLYFIFQERSPLPNQDLPPSSSVPPVEPPEPFKAPVNITSTSIDDPCKKYGWELRSPGSKIPSVIDVILLTNQLDLLEIRLRDLYTSVDLFVIIEADRTFAGQVKPLHFRSNLKRFAWAAQKIEYFVMYAGSAFKSSGPGFYPANKVALEGFVTRTVREMVVPREGHLILGMEASHVPQPSFVKLLKRCEGYPRDIHIQFQTFIYSFEFPTSGVSWAPRLTVYDATSFQFHLSGRGGGQKLKGRREELGWFCAYCFPTLAEFVFEMEPVSRSSLFQDESFRDLEEIQNRICEGIGVYQLPWNAYEIIHNLWYTGGVIEKKGEEGEGKEIGVPSEWLRSNGDKFPYLLPGGCVREDSPVSGSPSA